MVRLLFSSCAGSLLPMAILRLVMHGYGLFFWLFWLFFTVTGLTLAVPTDKLMACQGTGMELSGAGNWPEESHLASWEESRLLCQPLVPWWWSGWERDWGTEPRQAGVPASWQGLLCVWRRLPAVAGNAYEQCMWTCLDSHEALCRYRLLLLLLREVVIDVPPSHLV